ncbi:CHAP domain-containing protein [Novosphingobium terrae]|uniref:CHAP domain-containing protein n=1 Tax=Novosphingobium terrae TaxID=2726189 RepID=UPI001F137D72|nr:CHAP domain-containing protein [Novosphingobium terrae]
MLGSYAARAGAVDALRARFGNSLARALTCFASMAMLLSSAVPVQAGVLQCVPFARAMSGINIHGDADSWWGQAAHQFDRGLRPKIGAVLAFRATSVMPHGHVAVVDAILDDRHILLDHANWSQPGLIEQGVLAVDTSAAGDWSEVRVWYGPVHGLGSRESPAYGFIYGSAARPAISAFDRAFASMNAAVQTEGQADGADYAQPDRFAVMDERPVPQNASANPDSTFAR